MKEVKRLRRHSIVVLTDLDYADDISLFSDNVRRALGLLKRVELDCVKVSLSLHLKKTKVTVIREHPPVTTMGSSCTKDSQALQVPGLMGPLAIWPIYGSLTLGLNSLKNLLFSRTASCGP